MFDKKIYARVFAYAKPYKFLLITGALVTLVLAVISPIKPAIIGYMVSDLIPEGDRDNLFFYLILVLGVLGADAICRFLHTYIANLLGQKVILDLRIDLFRHIVKLRLKFFDNHPIGMLVTRAISDIETIGEIFSSGILVILGDVLSLLGVLVFMFYLNWKLTLIVLLPIPLLLIATRMFKNAIKKSYQEVRNQVSKLNTFVQERLVGINVVKIFNREEKEFERFKVINEGHRRAHIKSIWANAIFFPVVEILSSLSVGSLVFYTVYEVDNGLPINELTGQLLAFLLYIHMLYRPIRMLADKFNTLQMGLVGSTRVFKVLDTDEEIKANGIYTPKEVLGKINFDKVNFAYNEPEWVLKNLCLDIDPGQMVAIVGETGAGKSSIINLLGRFYEYQSGTILLDDRDIRSYDPKFLRSKIAVVLQDVFLFNGSIFENITLGNPEISRDKVVRAAKLVGAHDFIIRLEGAYDFNVGERGGMLSVGQKQLLAFIRAYVFNPAILILDEATSSIDSQSEVAIQGAINVLTKGRTSVIIAHRLSTIKNADKIIVLDRGEIKEIGSHQELIKKGGIYAGMLNLG